jgi:hypothetical protein
MFPLRPAICLRPLQAALETLPLLTAHKSEMDGLRLYDDATTPGGEARLGKLQKSLRLIQAHDQLRYQGLKRGLRRLLIAQRENGRYFSTTRMGVIGTSFVEEHSEVTLAFSVLELATRGRMLAALRDYPFTESSRVKILRRAIRSQLTFLERLSPEEFSGVSEMRSYLEAAYQHCSRENRN